MINDDALMEVAKNHANLTSVETLRDATKGRDGDSLGGPSKKMIKDLVRYLNLAHCSVDDDEQYQNHTLLRECRNTGSTELTNSN